MLKTPTMNKTSTLIFLLFFVSSVFGQSSKHKLVSTTKHQFKDTLYSIVCDNFVHDLGTIPNRDSLLVKYFKYVGNDRDPVFISRTWTGDPYYISQYPKGILKKGEIYSITINFCFSGRPAKFEKAMGFYLSNGENIKFIFKGNVVKNESNNIEQINPHNDSSLYYGAKSFMLHVLKALEPPREKRNEDSICRAFIPIDTLTARIRNAEDQCIERFKNNTLDSNAPAFGEMTYEIDSSSHISTIEKSVFYFRVNLSFKQHIYGKPYGRGFAWYKIWFDGKKYWLIPGHYYIDVCLDFIWNVRIDELPDKKAK
jgi:hypothetical protein